MASIKSILSFFVLVLAFICSTLSGVAEAGDKGGDVIIIGADGGAGGFGGGSGGAFGGFGGGNG